MDENASDARNAAIEVVRGMVGSDNLSSRYAMRYIDDVERAILAERERSAQVAENMASRHGWNYHTPSVGREIALAIRSGVEDGRG